MNSFIIQRSVDTDNVTEARANAFSPTMHISQVSDKNTTDIPPHLITTPRHDFHIPIEQSPISSSSRHDLLIKTNQNIAPDSGSEMDFGLEVKLDSDHEGGILELAVGVDRALEEVS